MDEKKTTKGRGFSSPLMMAISLIAASVGLGNIWRFPRVMATNGGSAFVVAYVVIMLIAVIPVMMGEHVIGRCTRKGLPVSGQVHHRLLLRGGQGGSVRQCLRS